MDRRQAGNELYRQKFEAFGLSERFVFIGRNWETHKGKQCQVKCKTCGETFDTWNPDAIFKGKIKRLACPTCGITSDGEYWFIKSKKCDEAMAYYKEGHSQKETAEKYGVPVYQIENARKARGISNGLSTHQRTRKQRVGSAHRHRAKILGCQYDPTVTLERLIKRDGLRCAICGELCDKNDKRWNSRFGPMYPTIDHIKPMSKGGGHVWSNVQVAHSICNTIKNDAYAEVVADG